MRNPSEIGLEKHGPISVVANLATTPVPERVVRKARDTGLGNTPL